MRAKWTPTEIAELTRRYPHEPTQTIASGMRRSVSAVFQRAIKMGLSKTPEYFESDASGRVQKGRQNAAMRATQFQAGHATWNKGRPGSTGLHPNCRRTQFRKGSLSGKAKKHLQQIGATSVWQDGIVMRKVSDTGNRKEDWRPEHVLIWESSHGPVPSGHIVVFADHNHRNFDDSNLELVTRAELMRRNSYLTRYPKEIADLIRMRGQLNRKINKRSKA